MPFTPHLLEDKPGEYRVWSEGPGQMGHYTSPVARVFGDVNKNWVFIETGGYQACVMINRETLPKLIEALQRLEKHFAD